MTTFAGCTGGGVVGRFGDHVWVFTPPATATYRFRVCATNNAALDVYNPRSSLGWVAGRNFELPVTLSGGEAYLVTVNGQWLATGDYRLAISTDVSPTALVRPEDPTIVDPLLARAKPIGLGRTFGTLESASGGVRARCGGLGSDTVYRLTIAPGGRSVRLRAAAQFPVAFELRDGSGQSIACARSAQGAFDVEMTQRLAEGDYLLVLDATALSAIVRKANTDLIRDSYDPLHPRSGAAIRGAYVLDLESSE
ncbi:MAG TPA: hypothetical protein VM694_00370 [Polyangium sp.]|nr:hypothetical protein [Polyangium sp.]